MLVTCRQIRDAEESAFAGGIDPEALMDRAGFGIAALVRQFHPRPGTVIPVVGRGHNGGDALVAASALREGGWSVHPWLPFPPDALRPLTRRKLRPFADHSSSPPRLGDCRPPIVFLDGLLGIGAEGPLRGDFRTICRTVNALRTDWHAFTVAVDIPTGLDGDTGSADPDAIVADVTATIAHAKHGLVADGATNHVGRLAVVPLGELDGAAGDSSVRVATPPVLARLAGRRPFDCHKGDFGRIGILAGSRGMIGAGVMASAAAVRAGGGLVTLFVPEDVYSVVAAAAMPEVMVRPVLDHGDVLEAKLDVLAAGPGLGLSRATEMLGVLRAFPGPVILDADALNALAGERLASLANRRAPSLLTPHPGEMEKLLGADSSPREEGRADTARRFVAEHPGTVLLLKGARTVVAGPDRPLSFNTTGNPGMATGGMGDVLTGLCAALVAASPESGADALHDAACLGAWLAGRAAERAMIDLHRSVESLSATDLLTCLGPAFTDLREGVF